MAKTPSRPRKPADVARRLSSPGAPPPAAFPEWIPPCLPTLVNVPPEGAKWQHEVKWDGYRVSAYLHAGKVTKAAHALQQRLDANGRPTPEIVGLQGGEVDAAGAAGGCELQGDDAGGAVAAREFQGGAG